MSMTEFSNRSCITTRGRLREVSHTESDRSRLPTAQHVYGRELDFFPSGVVGLENTQPLNLQMKYKISKEIDPKSKKLPIKLLMGLQGFKNKFIMALCCS